MFTCGESFFNLCTMVWFVGGIVVGAAVGWFLATRPSRAPLRRPAQKPPQRAPLSRPPAGARAPQGPAPRQGAAGPRGGSESGSPASSGGTGRGVELYVGNLPYETGDKDLQQVFERFGRVLSVRMIENRRNGKPKGFGFVEMDSDASADAAIKAMNGADYQGRVLVVNEAKSRARRN